MPIKIKGKVSEVSHGLDHDVLTVSTEKQKSKIKVPFGDLADYSPGDEVYITLDRHPGLFDEEGHLVGEGPNASEMKAVEGGRKRGSKS